MKTNKKEAEILDFIKRYIATKGYSPTIREIAAGLYIKSPSTVQDYLKRLVSSGIITTTGGKSRTIELLVQNEYVTTSEKIVPIAVLDKKDNSIIKEFLDIPIFMLNNYDARNLYVFKENKIVYIINSSLHLIRPSLIVQNDEFVIDENPKDAKEIFGNIISEFRIY